MKPLEIVGLIGNKRQEIQLEWYHKHRHSIDWPTFLALAGMRALVAEIEKRRTTPARMHETQIEFSNGAWWAELRAALEEA